MEVIAVACGQRHSLAIDDQGCVWAWGQNAHGQCGLVHLNNPVPEPAPVNLVKGRRANRIACGARWNRTLALTLIGGIPS